MFLEVVLEGILKMFLKGILKGWCLKGSLEVGFEWGFERKKERFCGEARPKILFKEILMKCRPIVDPELISSALWKSREKEEGTSRQVQPHTLPMLLGVFEVQRGDAPHAVLAFLVVHQEAFLLQQIGFQLAILVPSERMEICRLRFATRTRAAGCSHRHNWSPGQPLSSSSI